MRKLYVLSLAFFLLFPAFAQSLILMIPIVHADIIVTKEPTDTWVIIPGWANATYAYTSNDLRTETIVTISCAQGYRGYGFDIPAEATITDVEFGSEGYRTSGTLVISHAYTPDNGVNWYALAGISNLPPDQFRWTSQAWYNWTSDNLNDTNFATRITHVKSSGCYGLDGEVGLWGGGVKLVRDVEIGDVLTGWNFTHYVPATVLNATLHTGNWALRRIICESLDRPNDFKDCLVTPDHILPYFDLNKLEGDITKVKIKEDKAQDFKIRTDTNNGYGIFGYIESKVDEQGKVIIEHFEPYEVVSNEEMNTTEGVMDIVTDQKYFMGHYLLAKKEPTTGYVDSLPVRVTYAIGGVNFLPYGLLAIFILTPCIIIVFALRRKHN